MWPGGTLHSDILGSRKAFVLLPPRATVPEHRLQSCCGCHSVLFAAPRRLLSTLAAVTAGINSPLEIRRGMKTFRFTLLRFITVRNSVVFPCQGSQNKAPQTGGLNKTRYFFRQDHLDRLAVEKDQGLKTAACSPQLCSHSLLLAGSGPSPSSQPLPFSKQEWQGNDHHADCWPLKHIRQDLMTVFLAKYWA